MKNRFLPVAGLCAIVMAFGAAPAAAYIGPGLGLGVIASIFGAIAAFLMMIAGLVWYPVKIMLRKRREKKASASAPAATTAAAAADAKPDAPAN